MGEYDELRRTIESIIRTSAGVLLIFALVTFFWFDASGVISLDDRVLYIILTLIASLLGWDLHFSKFISPRQQQRRDHRKAIEEREDR